MKKHKFKKHLNNKILLSAFEYLNSIKTSHSKVKNIVYRKFKIARYLTESKFNIDDKILLFSLRTRMVDVKCNFKNGNIDILCSCPNFRTNELKVWTVLSTEDILLYIYII